MVLNVFLSSLTILLSGIIGFFALLEIVGVLFGLDLKFLVSEIGGIIVIETRVISSLVINRESRRFI